MAAAPRQLFVVFARAFATVVTVATSASDVALVVVVVVVALSSSLPRGGMTRRWRVVREAEKRRNKSNNKTHERVETKVEVVAVALKQKRVKGVKVVGSGGCCARARRRREREKGTVFLFDASCLKNAARKARERRKLPVAVGAMHQSARGWAWLPHVVVADFFWLVNSLVDLLVIAPGSSLVDPTRLLSIRKSRVNKTH